MALKPYVYVETNKSKDVQREAPEGVRVAVHYPEIGRTVELHTNAHGDWWLEERPAPGHGGRAWTVAEGKLDKERR